MKHFALLITAALLVLAPQALRAHDYKDATMRFTVPDDYSYEPFNNEQQGITGFTAEKDGVKTTLFRITTDKRIDRSAAFRSATTNGCLPSPNLHLSINPIRSGNATTKSATIATTRYTCAFTAMSTAKESDS